MTIEQVLSFDALGTRWWIDAGRQLPAGQRKQLRATVDIFEANYSRFRADSLIGRLNDVHEIVTESSELREMLDFALCMFDATDGVFNITIGAQLEQSGYGRAPVAASHVSQHIHTDIWWDAARVGTAKHVRLDFGGFGKAWLIDVLAKQLAAMGYTDFTVNGGGDIYIGGQQEAVLIEHPVRADLAIGEVYLTDASVCSSSRQKRVWRAPDGSLASHIPPAGGNDGADIASMHVRAQTALFADTFATVFLLVAHPKRQELANRFELEYMEVHSDGTFWQSPGFGFQPFH